MNTDTLITKKKSGKNALIEFMRFLFALWVLYFHSYVPFKNDRFSDGDLAVEFFFVLTGFFLIRSMKKYISLPLKEGLKAFLLHRFKAIAVPFLISEVFVLIYSLGFDFSINFLFGYMWYIRDLFIAVTLFFLLRKYIKKDILFYSLIAAASAAVLILRWPGGAFRSIAMMPLGMLASLIPPIKIKKDNLTDEKKSSLLSLAIFIPVALYSLWVISKSEKSDAEIYILAVILYPALLYFANGVKFSNGFMSYLGSLSFPIYAFQCILRVIEAFGFTDEACLFIILAVLVLTFSLWENLRAKRRKKAQN